MYADRRPAFPVRVRPGDASLRMVGKAEAVGKPLDRLGPRQALDTGEEGDGVAAAAVAVEVGRIFAGIDHERRISVGVTRMRTRPAQPGAVTPTVLASAALNQLLSGPGGANPPGHLTPLPTGPVRLPPSAGDLEDVVIRTGIAAEQECGHPVGALVRRDHE